MEERISETIEEIIYQLYKKLNLKTSCHKTSRESWDTNEKTKSKTSRNKERRANPGKGQKTFSTYH